MNWLTVAALGFGIVLGAAGSYIRANKWLRARTAVLLGQVTAAVVDGKRSMALKYEERRDGTAHIEVHIEGRIENLKGEMDD